MREKDNFVSNLKLLLKSSFTGITKFLIFLHYLKFLSFIFQLRDFNLDEMDQVTNQPESTEDRLGDGSGTAIFDHEL